MIEYRVYRKRELESNPRNARVSETFTDSLNAQSYATKVSYTEDAVILKVDTDTFEMGGDGSTYYGRGVLDVNFFPKKATFTGKPTHIYYNHPKNIFSRIYRNIGAIIRIGVFCCLIYFFVDALHANELIISLPQGANSTANYDVGVGAKYIANEVYNYSQIAYNNTTEILKTR